MVQKWLRLLSLNPDQAHHNPAKFSATWANATAPSRKRGIWCESSGADPKQTKTAKKTHGNRDGNRGKGQNEPEIQTLAVKVELKLQRRRTQARRGDLAVVLQLHIRVDEVFGEDVAFGEELEIVLQSLQRCLE